MKQFLSILKFELMGYLKNKVFLGTTISLIVVVGLVIFSPQLLSMFKGGEGSDAPEAKEVILLSDLDSTDKNVTLEIFKSAFPDKSIQPTNKTVEELTALIDGEGFSSAIVITGKTDYTYIVKNMGMYDTTQAMISELMSTRYRVEQMTELGLSPAQANSVLNANINSNVVQTGKDQFQNYFYTYILIFALYMAIILYGQLVATSVASEKSSRAMEVLITSAKPVNLMFGKVFGAGLAGLIQMVAIFGSSFVFFNLNKGMWGDNIIVNSIFNMPLSTLLYATLFFVLGYFIYSFLYGAVGSLASKVEDINTSSMPLTFLFIIAFMIVVVSMNTGDMDGALMVIASHVPFTSPMAMFARIAMSEVAVIEIIISVVILLLSTIGIGYLSAKIYKVGVLMYGKPPKMKDVIKALKQK